MFYYLFDFCDDLAEFGAFLLQQELGEIALGNFVAGFVVAIFIAFSLNGVIRQMCFSIAKIRKRVLGRGCANVALFKEIASKMFSTHYLG